MKSNAIYLFVLSLRCSKSTVLLYSPKVDLSIYVSGYAMLLMNTGNLDQAIGQFTDIIKVAFL